MKRTSSETYSNDGKTGNLQLHWLNGVDEFGTIDKEANDTGFRYRGTIHTSGEVLFRSIVYGKNMRRVSKAIGLLYRPVLECVDRFNENIGL